jgi:hypothetical protein
MKAKFRWILPVLKTQIHYERSMTMITKEDIVKDFTAGIDCSQVVLRECSEKIGLSAEQACKIASPPPFAAI